MYRYRIQEIRQSTPRALLLTLQPEHPEKRLIHVPGQYVALGFRRHGRPSPMRCFSLVNAPGEALQFAMRIGGSFTQTVADLQVGDLVDVQGPFGEFTIDPQYDRNVILLAGGIGITPFISMARQATALGQPVTMTLLYSCQSQDDIPFFAELLELQRHNPRFHVYFFITNGKITPIPGVKLYPGRITEATLTSVTGRRFNSFTYFLCGPTGFITALQAVLFTKGTEGWRVVDEAFSQGAAQGRFQPKRGVSTQVYGFTGVALVAGVVAIMALDLIRAVPKIASVQTASASTLVSQSTPSPSPTDPTTPASVDSSVTSNQSTSVATPTPTPTSTPTPTPTQTYRMPVSSVS